MTITYDEIMDGDQFEDLVASYFRELKDSKENNITNVEILQSGIGTDGGRDILIEFDISDDIKIFKRKWVVQCKFHNSTISPSNIQTVNIPSLIHSYGASGYLLVCKTRPTAGLTDLFENLNVNCSHRYQYEIWNGNQFLSKIYFKSNLHPIFFPLYNNYINSIKNKS